ncbi:TetR family transcriptional regulator [Mycolicibacterium madagascariense]|uniref:TetR family transcriptional regulator n=1 Tax=Mycolicibacterium madagascariense TaxID=212765 RepID=A0A7I7XEC3_9MYCO|nr:TetR/AcrR family transcriptional regulator C-terminal domain-containing protein [Mycolicibacterium madagascariense]MCV7011669.1 TetR/AcrR family transcriptional regulator C-terminal domain-containing protein [Mycolicibacterium madagascariense]BBZ27301.1 TetR family transcriptional regulator [Mycolicibacterium madagascariense]
MPRSEASSTSTPAKRGKPPNLTEKEIVDAALEIIRSEGLEALSMRRLSRELGRSAMAPYWYVADKQQLLDLVAGEVLSEVSLPSAESGSWEDRLRAVVEAIDARLRQHPGIAEILFARMQSTDRRLIRGIMGILLDAGFSDTDVLLGYAMIHTYLFGRYQVVMRAEWEEPEEMDETLARLLPLIPGLGGRDFFRFGVDTIIDGLRVRLARKG